MPQEDGFEYKLPGDEQATFFKWNLNLESTPHMRLIDHFAGVPIHVFAENLDDDLEKQRIPVLLTVIATSIETKYPEWSFERVVRTVEKFDWAAYKAIEADEDDAGPPAESTTESTSEDSTRPSDGSSSSVIPAAI